MTAYISNCAVNYDGVNGANISEVQPLSNVFQPGGASPEVSWTIFGEVASRWLMHTAVEHLFCSSFRWELLGYSGLVQWVAVQNRLKTTGAKPLLAIKMWCDAKRALIVIAEQKEAHETYFLTQVRSKPGVLTRRSERWTWAEKQQSGRFKAGAKKSNSREKDTPGRN